MTFDFENHTRVECFNAWGSLCMRCDPKFEGRPIYSFTFKVTELNEEAIKIALGLQA